MSVKDIELVGKLTGNFRILLGGNGIVLYAAVNSVHTAAYLCGGFCLICGGNGNSVHNIGNR